VFVTIKLILKVKRGLQHWRHQLNTKREQRSGTKVQLDRLHGWVNVTKIHKAQ